MRQIYLLLLLTFLLCGCTAAPEVSIEPVSPTVQTAPTESQNTEPMDPLQQLLDAEGFYHLPDTSLGTVNMTLQRAVQEKKNPRQAVLAYDWSGAVETLLRQHREKNA